MTNKEMAVGYRLRNFESEVGEISIPGQISINKVIVLDNFLEIGPMQWTEWHAQISGHSSEDIKSKGIALIYGLRLFKTGPVGIEEGIIESELSPSNLSEKEIPKLWSFFETDLEVPGQYILLKEEVEYLQKFLNKFFYIKTVSNNLVRTLRKFNTAIQTGDPKQRFIEFVGALECLLLPSESGEKTYKLANRVACLTGNEESSYRIFTEVKRLYSLRSGMVHGRQVNYEKLSQKLPRIESIVRRSILGALALNDRIADQKLTSKLDECLHSRSTKKIVRHRIQKFWEGITFPS